MQPMLATGHQHPHLDGLNDGQLLAATTLQGPVLVLAGAGTGKTRALISRFVHLLATQSAWPSEILAVTFTNKAALEMKQRISHMLPNLDTSGWWLGTFHGLSARMLRRHAELVGLTHNFTILDDSDQERVIKQILELTFGEGAGKTYKPSTILHIIDNWKNQGLTAADVAGDVQELGKAAPENLTAAQLAKIYTDYQARLKTLNACDFGDLLLHMLTLFKNSSNGVLAQYQARFKFVMVDEYQDTNHAQYKWLQALSGVSQNLCCVGDDDQAIYGWRGADVQHILKFGRDYPAAQIVRLEQNYRSTPAILGAANSLIKHNQSRLGKDLWTADTNPKKVQIKEYEDSREEARSVADALENLQQQKLPLNSMAVLVRTSAQMRAFEERWNYIGLPYRVVGGPRFYERQEIRDAIAYLRLVSQPADDLAFERIINLPKRGVGPKAIDDLRALARSRATNLLDALQQSLVESDVKPKLRETYRLFWQMYQNWQQALPNVTPTALAAQILEDSGYVAMWQADSDADAKSRLENLKELLNGLSEFPTLGGFLEHVSLVMENFANPAQDCVTLMTLHAAKGLEFNHVFLPGWEENLFPSGRAQDEQGLVGTEEERRLAYVGITRARQHCTISYAQRRLMYGQFTDALPSRFVGEIDPKFTEHTRLAPPTTQAYSNAPHVPRWLQQGHYPKAEKPSFTPAAQSLADTAFKVGQKVYNPKLGRGTVIAAEADRTHVRFDVGGMRTIMNSFLFNEHAAPQD